MYQRHANARSSTSVISALHSDKPVRESRIHSIYEKYLYDPKDLQSEDPVIRQLARKHSQRQQNQHKRMSSAAKKRQSTVGFAKGTKEDGPSSAANSNSKPRNSTGSAYEGFGALMDEYSDSDDSDNEGPRPPRAGASQQSKGAPVRESWGARAMAVGERPPDSASQNPPTLKLLGLKSQREGGQALGRPANAGASTLASPSYQRDRTPSPAFEMLSEEPNSRSQPVARHGINEQSLSEYGDGSSRVGSTIDFTGQGSDGFGGVPAQHMQAQVQPQRRPQPPQQQQASRSPPRAPVAAPNGGLQPSGGAGAVNPRKALTAQLGLDTPLPPTNPTTPNNTQQSGDYFTSKNAGGGEVLLTREERFSPPRAPAEAMVKMPSSSSSSFATSSSMEKTDPFGDASPPGRMLVAGPQGYGPRSPGASPVRPNGPPQQGYGRAPPPAALRAGGGPMPMPQPQFSSGPGFSDSRQPPQQQQQQQQQQQKRQSIFRRSMAFMTGTSGEPSMQQQQQPYDQQQQGPGGNKRQSIFRRSMAFLSGRPAPPPAAAPEPEEENHAPPRNHGFDNEKEMRSRKSQYLGGGNKGDEWDVNGAGANFWRRFNEAQKHANPNDKMELTSRKFTQKATSRQKMATWMAGLGGVLIIAAVIGVVIWREGKASSDNASPGSINKGEYGGTKVMQRSVPTAVVAAAYNVAARESEERDVWAAARVDHQQGPRSTPAASSSQVNKMQLVRRHKKLAAPAAQRREMEEETQL